MSEVFKFTVPAGQRARAPSLLEQLPRKSVRFDPLTPPSEPPPS